MKKKRMLCALIWWVLRFTTYAHAQTLTVTSRLVRVPVLAFGQDGTPLQYLHKEDFSVYDEGIEQTITTLSTDSDAPLAIALVLDVSGTQLPHLLENREVLIDFVRHVARPQDSVFLETFDSQARLVTDSDAPNDAVIEVLSRFSRERVNHPHWIGTGMSFACQGKQTIFEAPCGNSVVWNAVVNASEKLGHQSGRRALVLITDGEDSGSDFSAKDALKKAQDSAVAIFAIGLPDPYHGKLNRGGLKTLAKGTGGDVFFGQVNAQAAFSSLNKELRSEYVLTYKPSLFRSSSRFHHLSVRVKDARDVQFRAGYTETP